MKVQEQETVGEIPRPVAAGTRSDGVTSRARRLGWPAGLIGLAAGALCLVAACGSGTGAATPPAAGGPTATPTQSTTQPSSPAASSQPPASPTAGSGGSSGTVTAGPASSAQLAAFTTAAAGNCGFTTSADTLTNAKVTSNGWGSATITARNPQAQGNASMVFRLGSSWAYQTCGSSFDSGSIPQDVLSALGL